MKRLHSILCVLICYVYVTEVVRTIIKDSLGRNILLKNTVKKPVGYVILLYPSRAMEWIHLRQMYASCLAQFGCEQMSTLIDDVLIAWRYHDNLTRTLYQPTRVFKQFSFLELLDEQHVCACVSSKRLAKFLDPRTIDERSSFARPTVHVRTVDVKIIHYKKLRDAVAMGLNHIPMKPTTSFAPCIATILDGFKQIMQILGLYNPNFPADIALAWLRNNYLDQLKQSSRINRFGFRSSDSDLMRDHIANDEIVWLGQHLFCAGLDKAANNVSFICIKHMRLMALERLSGPEFQPCREDLIWLLPLMILQFTALEATSLVPELKISYQALPYLMSTYKLHKNSHRWLTNAFHTVYSNIAHMLTITTMRVLESVKEWAQLKMISYARFLKVETSLFWLVNLSIEVALNLPNKVTDIFVADITRCFESIPLTGPDNLIDAVAFVIKLGYKQAKSNHPRATPLIWVCVNDAGEAVQAQWASSKPSYGESFSLTAERLIEIHS